MKKVYTHENRLIVFHYRNLLQDAGIECQIRNEFTAGAAGDLAPFDTWPELWVSDDNQTPAINLILQQQQSTEKFHNKSCGSCGEWNAGHFHLCWNCSLPLDN